MARTITIINENETIKHSSSNFVGSCIDYYYQISNEKGELRMYRKRIKKGKKHKFKLNNVH